MKIIVSSLLTLLLMVTSTTYGWSWYLPVPPPLPPPAVTSAASASGSLACWWCWPLIPMALMLMHDLTYYHAQAEWYVAYVDKLNGPAQMPNHDIDFVGRTWSSCADATISAPVVACGGKGY